MYNINHLKFPCRICAKNVYDKYKTVQCDFCELWIHVKCNNLNYVDWRYLQKCDESWYCIECCSIIFPFNFLSSNKNLLACCTNTDWNITQWKDLATVHNSSLSLKPPSNLEHLVNQFNNATPGNSNGIEKISSSKYYAIEEMSNIEIPHKNESLSLFHLNAWSVYKGLDDLQHFLTCTKNFFDIIAISETRITNYVTLSKNLNLNNYFF